MKGEAQVMLSSIPFIAGKNTERNNKIHLINTSFKDCFITEMKSWLFIHGVIYMVTDLLETDGVCLSKRGKRIPDVSR